MSDDRVLAALPAMEQLLTDGRIAPLHPLLGRPWVVAAARTALEATRGRLRQAEPGTPADRASLVDSVCRQIEAAAAAALSLRLRPVLNGTGIILHTGLGRAPLAPAAVRHIAATAGTYSTLEVDPGSGERGHRMDLVAETLVSLTGAEAAAVVNNNAAAVLLVLAALSEGRETVVSRGHLVEIGGGFRMPEVMARSGAVMAEVGTTNRTHLPDYTAALSNRTAAILYVHTSNYRVVGFATMPALEAVVDLARRHGLPVIHDLGSGALVDLTALGLPGEPSVQGSVAAGAAVTTFSADKLLGGPQAGILVGTREIIERIRRHPLSRALRCGKLTLAALEATLREYQRGLEAVRTLPVYRMATAPLGTLTRRARHILNGVDPAIRDRLAIRVEPSEAEMGSGSLPVAPLPSRALVCAASTVSPHQLAAAFRSGSPPLFPYIRRDRVHLDMRTLLPAAPRDVAAVLNGLGPMLTGHA